MKDYTGKTVFVGMDVHKLTYSVTAICDGAVVKKDKLNACPRQFLKYCRDHFKGGLIKSAYEAGFSGFYLHRFLLANGIENIVVHAASIEVSAKDTVKTDRRDSLKIATQLSTNRLKPIYVPSEERIDKRNLSRLRENFVRQRIRVGCQLKSLLCFHGLEAESSRRHVCKSWIESLANLKVSENLRYMLVQYTDLWFHFDLRIREIDKRLDQELVSEKQVKSIYCSVPGIGNKAANVLINELGDTLQFGNENKLFSHAGLTPSEYSSGERVRHGHITRQGKPVIRRILVQAAWKAIKQDLSLQNRFEKLAKIAGKKRAIVAIARILLGRIRSCMKRKEGYLIEEPVRKITASTKSSKDVPSSKVA